MKLFDEMKRRHVFRVAAAYGVVAWLLIQVSDLALPRLGLPDWTVTLVIVLALIGFPLALVLAWAYQVTPEGVRADADTRAETGAATAGRRRPIDAVIMVGMALVIVVLIVDRLWLDERRSETTGAVGAVNVSTDRSATAAAATAGDGRSLAVLPFVNLSGNPENEYFADGLSEELMNVLAQVPALRVIGRTSSFHWKGRNEDLRTIGASLRVSHLLEGSVRRQADRVRITAQLIRAADGFHVWSQNYDRKLDDVFAVQDDIAANVVRSLEIVLDDTQLQRMRNAGVRDVDAFIAYQKGRELWDLAHQSDSVAEALRPAHEYFAQATARVPDFGDAHLLDADFQIHRLAAAQGYLTRAEQESAHAALVAALSAARNGWTDPLRRAIVDVELVLMSDDWRLLRDRVERVLAATGCARTLLFEQAMLMGYADSLVDLYRRESACDPRFMTAWWDMVASALWSGDLDKTLRLVDDAEAIFGSEAPFEAVRAYTLLALDRPAEAAAAAQHIPIDEDVYGIAVRGAFLAYTGRNDEALALATSRHEVTPPGAMDTRLPVYAMLGDRERANAIASEIDARPGGPALLLTYINICACGLPFEMHATPNLAARIAEAGVPWPPRTLIRFPLKTW